MRSHDTIFSGSIPELYDRHMAPVFMQPCADLLAARFGPGPIRTTVQALLVSASN